MKVKINLDTYQSIVKLVSIAGKLQENVMLTDNNGLVVSAKSILGSAYAKMEFKELWLECENDRYLEFREFIPTMES